MGYASLPEPVTKNSGRLGWNVVELAPFAGGTCSFLLSQDELNSTGDVLQAPINTSALSSIRKLCGALISAKPPSLTMSATSSVSVVAYSQQLTPVFLVTRDEAGLPRIASPLGIASPLTSQCPSTESEVPSAHLPTGIINTVIRSAVSSSARIGEPGRSAPHAAASVEGTRNIR
jgi:hypothetical protein